MLASPEEMLVFDPPLVAGVWGYRRLMLRPFVDNDARHRSVGPVRKAIMVVLILLVMAGLAYIAWSRIHDSGIIGWLDAFQARHGGTFREKTSVVTAFGYLMMVYFLGVFAVLRVGLAAPAPDGSRG